jgi:hypothetical protein
MANALKAINKRVKQLQKKHPKSKRTTLQKQAGREWKAGKLKARKKVVGAVKRKPAKRKRAAAPRKRAAAPRKKTVRRKLATVPKKKRVYKAKRTNVKAYKATRYKRISGKGKSMVPMLLGAAVLGVGAYLLLKRPTVQATNYGYVPTSNPARNDSANSILTWATAAGLGITAISKLITAINSSSDAQVQQAAAAPDTFAQSMLSD